MVMRALEGVPGIEVGGYGMNDIRYADDAVLIAGDERELREMLDAVVREGERTISEWEEDRSRGRLGERLYACM